MNKPEWFRKVIRANDLIQMRALIRENRLNTVCEEAACPNRGECYKHKTLTVMILGRTCTRNCRFCNVETKRPEDVDSGEPDRVARALSLLHLDYVVITSVTRDDLEDGGAEHFVKTIKKVKEKNPDTVLEVLVPDFVHSIHRVVEASPEVVSHNVETIPRLYRSVMPQANYEKSLSLLALVKQRNSEIYTKSGMMVGLGERFEEVLSVMRDLRDVGCDVFTIGQYARPSKKHIEVSEWIHPRIFEAYKNRAEEMGFLHVESGPYVRSSFHASEILKKIHYKRT
ncbi:MAG: lipoyl synthase [Deltaproteobacteria bacterium]|nr:lipoyl synthase [Deltaproteobacteria bacterium]MBW2332028.1 lipoyl synthase [Deltaproteobacteria bacterium]MCD6265821.1 lipoyl synthase [Deltaproteobacteria bacterium]OQY15616.1 MAG: lipoyl synthase [Desulfobacterium sp. 4572_20]